MDADNNGSNKTREDVDKKTLNSKIYNIWIVSEKKP